MSNWAVPHPNVNTQWNVRAVCFYKFVKSLFDSWIKELQTSWLLSWQPNGINASEKKCSVSVCMCLGKYLGVSDFICTDRVKLTIDIFNTVRGKSTFVKIYWHDNFNNWPVKHFDGSTNKLEHLKASFEKHVLIGSPSKFFLCCLLISITFLGLFTCQCHLLWVIYALVCVWTLYQFTFSGLFKSYAIV